MGKKNGDSFHINGKKINPNRIGDTIEASIVQGIQQVVINAVWQLPCTHHGKNSKIRIIRKDLDNIQLGVSACCDEFIRNITAKLQNCNSEHNKWFQPTRLRRAAEPGVMFTNQTSRKV